MDKMILLSVMQLQQAFEATLYYADKYEHMSSQNLRAEDLDKKTLSREFKIPDEMPNSTDYVELQARESALDTLHGP